MDKLSTAVGGLLLAGTRGFGALGLRLPRWLGVALALGWMALIHRLSSGAIPMQPRVPLAGFFNNLAHAPLFGLLALFWIVALPRRGGPFPWARLDGRALAAVLLAVFAWGAVDELHQARVPERDGNLADALTDLVGAAAVLACAWAAGEPDMRPRRFALLVLGCLAACALAAALSTLTGG